MKVLYVEASSGQVVGGSLTGMLELVAGLDRSVYEPAVLLYEDKPVIKDLVSQGIPVRVFSKRRLPKEHALQDRAGYVRAKRAPGVTRALKNLRAALTFLFETFPAALRLSRFLGEEAPDIIHVCNGFRGNMDAIVAARLRGIPCVVHSKGFDKHGFIERFFAPGVAASVCMTKAIEDHCRRQGIRPPEYNVVYDGLDLDAFRPTRSEADVREELGIALSALVVGVVGNIQEWKGQLVLLQAMVEVRKRHPAAVALIIGGVHRSGLNYSRRLQAFVAENDLEDNVIMTGARDDVSDLMRSMDVIAHTSVRREPFGRVIIEGMSVGRPVLATRAGGVPELITDGTDGILVPAGDPAALAEVLIGLFDDRELRDKLGRGALEKVKTFSVEHHVSEMARIYERVANRFGIVVDEGGSGMVAGPGGSA
ncbi:MAG: glycosyltransferase family 4 protein [Deltaproteobacteria bacterium]